MNKDKKGKWGKQCLLPSDVKKHCEDIINSDYDWNTFKSMDGKVWCVAKHYDDKNSYCVIASVIQWESDLIIEGDDDNSNRNFPNA